MGIDKILVFPEMDRLTPTLKPLPQANAVMGHIGFECSLNDKSCARSFFCFSHSSHVATEYV